ncbi:LAMI_0F06062g1_1 [Lachancea mirantina]|uniref:LAMI_0F06062g1_1 n=1 Tax=Lachancea mirantina TaxID=1230905 RepID=A0A1G4JYX0_9SACH|nr:LAMI_0F06062g1_1 [Lachancea mirantina]
MEFCSPQPEYTELSGVGSVNGKNTSRLLAALHNRVVSATGASSGANGLNSRDGTLDTVLDDHLIPSPPLSPKLGALSGSTGVRPLYHVVNPNPEPSVLWVRPSWALGPATPGHVYRSATSRFLSQYRFWDAAKSKRVMKNHSNDRVTRRGRLNLRSKDHLSNVPASERVSRTRNGGYKFTRSEDDDEDYDSRSDAIGGLSRPSTPLNRRVRKRNPVFSPLASAGAVNTAPNMSWEKLVDYSPSLSTLPDNSKCLKVDWKGSSMDLSDDPLRDKLHPAELVLAQTLRLPCDLYLDSKRRLFLEKVHRLKQDLPFRRTDAQKACRIDVNKASRLFAAYERIGWLQDKNFTKFL